MCFQDKIAIVTGGGSGIGKEIATRFVAEGGSVVIGGRDPSKLTAAAGEIDPFGARVSIVPGDIARPGTSTLLVEEAENRFGGVDVLFNIAAIINFRYVANALWTTEEAVRRIEAAA